MSVEEIPQVRLFVVNDMTLIDDGAWRVVK